MVYRPAVFNYRTDRAIPMGERQARPDAVLIFDGVFLLRPELRDAWDFTVFLEVSFEETLRRVTVRDKPLFGPSEAVRDRYERRYIPGQRLYLNAVRPQTQVDVVINNEDPSQPLISVHRGRRLDQGGSSRNI